MLLDRAACVFSGALLVPLRSGDRTLLIGVRRNQAGIDRKPFTADKPCRNARFDNMLEDAAKNVAVTKPLIARARERGMIRDLVFDRKPTEPAIGQVDPIAAKKLRASLTAHILRVTIAAGHEVGAAVDLNLVGTLARWGTSK
jgi:hypothetical protein